MSSYSVAEAKNKLPQLINRALDGEGVVITRHGRPVVELKAIQPAAHTMTEADWQWLEANRLPRLDPNKDAVEVVRETRDDAEV
jgi:prevent-host-death family protein